MTLRVTCLFLVLAAALVPGAAAQSISAGEVVGRVVDSGGHPLSDADVIVRDPNSGVERFITVTPAGEFRFALLPPGDYEVFAERLGYRPQLVRSVTVRPGVVLSLTPVLAPAPPPVSRVDTTFYGSGVFLAASSRGGEWLGRNHITGLPDDSRSLGGAAEALSTADSRLNLEGLPGSASGTALDGLPVNLIGHGGFPLPGAAGLARSAFSGAEVVAGGPDVEWSDVAGAYLSGFSLQGTDVPVVRGFADFTGSTLSSSKYFATDATANNSLRGGLLIAGPIIPDTAHFVLGFEGQRLQTPLPAAWSLDTLVSLARNSFATDLSAYTAPRISTERRLTGFGRFDWQFADNNSFGVSANYRDSRFDNSDLGPGALPSIGSSRRATDFVAEATLASALSSSALSELRVGLEYNTLTDTATGLVGTMLPSAGVMAGIDPGLAGQFQRTAILLRETLHLGDGPHRVKFGVDVTAPSYQVTYLPGAGGLYTFGGLPQLASRTGEFVQAVGVAPSAQFSLPEFGGYFQDTWSAGSGLQVLVGMRYDGERFPSNAVAIDSAWEKATGLSNGAVPSSTGKFSPRFGLSWDIGQRRTWLANVEAGSFYGLLDPGVMAELITEDGEVSVRRGLGALGAWPAAPDSTVAPVMGPRLTLLGPDFQAPRTRRLDGGLVGTLGRGFVLRVNGDYRHTDFLPRRADLNLAQGPASFDQYGRPIYGQLVQQGGLVAGQPGTNRRFSGFDLVSAINPDGYSDYWGLTFGLEQALSSTLKLSLSYTYSQTTDNWLSGWRAPGDPEAQLSPFPGGVGGTDWTKGTSDFDVPHRLTLSADLTLRRLHNTRVSAFFRYQSGYPFTPGFRPGVDANGDGSGTNDPAFVDDTVSGMRALLGQWPCVSSQAGRFVARNSCRASGIASLDARLEVPVVSVGGYPIAVELDLVNLLESDVGLVDQALYLVDPSRAVTTSGGVTRVPLIANPDFGKTLIHTSPGRFLRLGARVNW